MTRLAGIALAVGFFFACTPLNKLPNQHNADKNSDLNSALANIDSKLSANPNDAALYFEKASVLGILAENETVDGRTGLYTDFAEALIKSRELSDDNSMFAKIDSLNSHYWQFEYGEAVNSYEKGAKHGFFDEALAHGTNALTINRDNAKTYKLLSTLYYQKGDIDTALSILNEAQNKTDNLSLIFEELGFLYLETGKPERSAYYYSLANPDGISNKNAAFGLANAYIAANDMENALDILRQLNTKYPHDTQIMIVYGTQLYTKIDELFQKLDFAYQQSDLDKTETILEDIKNLSKVTGRILNEAHDRDKENVEYLETLAVYYNNMANQYLNLVPNGFKQQQKELNIQAQASIDLAINSYEKLIELSAQDSKLIEKVDALKQLK